MKLQGRKALITGASQGLGAAIAETFIAEGASIMICARSAAELEATRKRLESRLTAGQRVLAEVADVSVEADVERLFAAALAAFGRLDVLVNNAGVYGPIGPTESVDWKEWLDAVAININGTVYPSILAARHFRNNGYGKIINLSGGGATAPLPRITAYATSKAAVVRFTESLALELAEVNVDVNAMAPGALATRLSDQLLAAGPEAVGAQFHARMAKIKAEGATPLATGAALCAYLASAESDGITGKLISAVWDPWPFEGSVKAELQATEIYTLRRIVPEDRGKTWAAKK